VQNNVGCSQTFLASLSYSQVAGLFLGMVVVGFTVDRIGRRAGSITTALIMTAGTSPTLLMPQRPPELS
jgi:MFS family permease